MKKLFRLATLAFAIGTFGLASPAVAAALRSTASSSHGSHAGTKATSGHTRPAPKPPTATKATTRSKKACASCARNDKGRIARSEAAKDAFKRQTGYSHGRPGYVIDHIKPLACGGADSPANMQWQTTAAAKAKDKIERKGC
jgi:hypothetical protein